MEVATRFRVPPEAVFAWNAAKFYGVVECLVNSAREAEVAAEEEGEVVPVFTVVGTLEMKARIVGFGGGLPFDLDAYCCSDSKKLS